MVALELQDLPLSRQEGVAKIFHLCECAGMLDGQTRQLCAIWAASLGWEALSLTLYMVQGNTSSS